MLGAGHTVPEVSVRAAIRQEPHPLRDPLRMAGVATRTALLARDVGCALQAREAAGA